MRSPRPLTTATRTGCPGRCGKRPRGSHRGQSPAVLLVPVPLPVGGFGDLVGVPLSPPQVYVVVLGQGTGGDGVDVRIGEGWAVAVVSHRSASGSMRPGRCWSHRRLLSVPRGCIVDG